MATLPAHLKRSLTMDQGNEVGRHHEFFVAAGPRKTLGRDTPAQRLIRALGLTF
jgi:hypothetical protein